MKSNQINRVELLNIENQIITDVNIGTSIFTQEIKENLDM